MPLHGAYLHKFLSKHYNVVWVGKSFSIKISPLSVLYILFLELLKILNIIRKTRFSLIFVQYVSLDGLVAIALKRIFKVKVVLLAVGSDVLKVKEHVYVYPLIRKVIVNSDMIFCVNSSIESLVIKINGDSLKIKTMPSLVDLSDFRFHGGLKKYDVVSVGTLNSMKNQKLLLDACKLLPKTVKILMIGNGPTRGALEVESIKCGLDVNFTGTISHKQVFTKLQESKLFVHTSGSEGLPVVVLEAMFIGLPIILVSSPYVYDITERYRFKVHIVNEASAVCLASKVNELLQDYETVSRIAISNKPRLLKLINHTQTEMKEILDELCK